MVFVDMILIGKEIFMSQSVRLKFGFLSGVIFEFEFSRVVNLID